MAPADAHPMARVQRRGSAAPRGALALAALFAPAAALAAADAGPSASAPAAVRSLPKFRTVEEGLALSAAQQAQYDVAFGRRHQITEESAFTMWLRRVARMPALGEEAFGALDRPSVRNLVRRPERYKGQAMRLRFQVVRVARLMPARGEGLTFTATRQWTVRDGPVWQVDGYYADAAGDRRREPVRLISVVDPAGCFGRPPETGERGEGIYPWPTGPVCEAAGVFYKLVASPEPGKVPDFPVVMVWQLRRGDGAGLTTAVGTRLAGLVAAVVAMVAAFLYLRRRVRRARRPATPAAYAPRRDLTDQPPPDRAPGAQDADEVDPALKTAAEQYRKEKGLDDEQDHPGRPRPAQL
jgi:hypothetical protein